MVARGLESNQHWAFGHDFTIACRRRHIHQTRIHTPTHLNTSHAQAQKQQHQKPNIDCSQDLWPSLKLLKFKRDKEKSPVLKNQFF